MGLSLKFFLFKLTSFFFRVYVGLILFDPINKHQYFYTMTGKITQIIAAKYLTLYLNKPHRLTEKTVNLKNIFFY